MEPPDTLVVGVVADSASFISSGVMGCVMWRPSYLRLGCGDLSGVNCGAGCVRYLQT